MSFDKNKIQELYPEAVMYEAMLINKGNDDLLKNACESGKYFGQLKKDGYWYQFEKHNHYSYLFSRSASRKTNLQTEKLANVPHIADALDCLPPDTILVGEIYYPGGSSKSVTEIMGCLPKKAVERQQGDWGLIHYYIHDILMYDGVDLVKTQVSNELRYKILEKIFYLHHLNKYDFLELSEVWYDSLYEKIGDALKSGEEGMVIKKKTGIYEPGKRPTDNLKAKKMDFADAVIIGFGNPTKEYYGKEIESWEYWIDAEGNRCQGLYYGKSGYTAVTKPYFYKWFCSRIIIGAYLGMNEDNTPRYENIGIIHSGIPDEMKECMSKFPLSFLNKVCSIQMMEVDKKEHTIRHGFFKGIREDKSFEECTLSTIF